MSLNDDNSTNETKQREAVVSGLMRCGYFTARGSLHAAIAACTVGDAAPQDCLEDNGGGKAPPVDIQLADGARVSLALPGLAGGRGGPTAPAAPLAPPRAPSGDGASKSGAATSSSLAAAATMDGRRGS